MKLGQLSFAILSTLIVSASASAETVNGGTVHFVGELVNATCAISTESANQTVDLGQYRTTPLASAGVKTTPVPFTIKLVDCEAATTKSASIAFSGQTTTDTLLAVSAAGGNSTAAQNVGIEISDSASKILKLDGTGFSTPKPLIAGDNTLDFSARYVSTGTATAGRADADATFVVKYE